MIVKGSMAENKESSLWPCFRPVLPKAATVLSAAATTVLFFSKKGSSLPSSLNYYTLYKFYVKISHHVVFAVDGLAVTVAIKAERKS